MKWPVGGLRAEGFKRWFPLIFAVVMGVVAAGLVKRYLDHQQRLLKAERERLAAQYAQPIDVAVASQDLPEGTVIEMSHIQRVQIPERFVQPYAARSRKDIVGKVTAVPIAEGEQILTNKLRRPEEWVPEAASLSSVTPKGKRAVTILVDSLTGVGGFVRPGDIVDVLWTIVLKLTDQKEGEAVTWTLLQDTPVLAVGNELMGQRGGEPQRPSAGQPGQYMVTLGLTPQETSYVLIAREHGKIQLSLRPKLESGAQVVAPASFSALLQQLGLQVSQDVATKTVREIEVYRGLERSVVSLSDE